MIGIEFREFGFTFEISGRKYMRRKLSFKTERELWYFINGEKPLDSYVSVAYYKYPVQMKDWFGADLFFDFDSLNLKEAFADALTTYEALLDDFGLKEVQLIFSGSKGYHVVVFDEEIRGLDSKARREIVDYLKGRYNITTLDEVSTVDLKRLRRVPGTVNPKSGRRCCVLKSTMKEEQGSLLVNQGEEGTPIVFGGIQDKPKEGVIVPSNHEGDLLRCICGVVVELRKFMKHAAYCDVYQMKQGKRGEKLFTKVG